MVHMERNSVPFWRSPANHAFESVLTREMEVFCHKAGFRADPNATMEVDGILTGDYKLDF